MNARLKAVVRGSILAQDMPWKLDGMATVLVLATKNRVGKCTY